MRNIIFTLAIFLLLSSCRNVKKMVEKGEYDKAISFAVKKMQGKEKKKTKYVMALEEAFEKETKRDMDKIAYLEGKKDPTEYDRIYDLYQVIGRRQNTILPILPLISEDGYKADFKFVKVNERKIEVANKSIEYHYSRALALLIEADNGDKLAARRAYDELVDISDYTQHYKDVDQLKNKAVYLGTDRIEYNVSFESHRFVPQYIVDNLYQVNLSEMNDFWTEFYINVPDDVEIDYSLVLRVLDINVSGDNEQIKRHVDTKKIEVGEKVEYQKTGVDSTGVVLFKEVIVPDIQEVSAEVIEIFRTKESNIRAELALINERDNNLVNHENMVVVFQFDEVGLDINGDIRAICDKHGSDEIIPSNFPRDDDMLLSASNILKDDMKFKLRKWF